MLHYELSIDAEKDLQDIARYTLNTWGKTIFEQYRNGLKKTFNAIGNREVLEKGFSKQFPELLVTKFKYHFVFYILNKQLKPLIIGVIHEQRDIVKHLSERLD